MHKLLRGFWLGAALLFLGLAILIPFCPSAGAQGKKAARPSLTILAEYQIDQRDHVQSLAFSPDGHTLAIGGRDVWLFDVGEGEPKQKGMLRTNIFFGVKDMAFSPDGSLLAVAGGDKTVRLWDLNAKRELQVLKEHAAAVVGVSFSPDGKLLASSSDDNNAILWNVEGGQAAERAVIKTNDKFGVRAVAFNPKGKLLATTSGSGQVRLWDVSGQAPKQTGALKTPGGIFEMRMAYAPDGRSVAVASHKVAYTLGAGGRAQALTGHKENVKDIAFTPDSRTLVSAGEDGRLIFWNLSTGRARLTKDKPGKFSRVAVAPLPEGTKSAEEILVAASTHEGHTVVLRLGTAKR